MSDYTKSTNFAVKDNLVSGHPDKVVSGVELDTEFEAIEVAVGSKEDVANKGAADGYCPLDGGGLVALSDLPAIVTTLPRVTSGLVTGSVYATDAEVTLNTSDMAAGRAFTVYNDSDSDFNIVEGAGVTLRVAGTADNGDVVLTAHGFATIWCNSGAEAIISGNVTLV